ncbi:MAG: redoxin domain-containing protein [Holosporales bacterium]|jgi:peroxiredoxin
MKKIFFLALLFGGFIASPAFAAPTVGQPAPVFTAVDSTGKTVKLSDYLGKTVVLEWTNHECPFVRKFYDGGTMQALQQNAAKNGIVWLSVISSAPGKQGHVTPAQANEITASRKAAPAAVLLDESGALGRLYDARTTPNMFIINKKGTLVYAGAIDSNPSSDPKDIPAATNYVTQALGEMAEGKAISVATTKPYGCSVKY